jgi:hypothetical protein
LEIFKDLSTIPAKFHGPIHGPPGTPDWAGAMWILGIRPRKMCAKLAMEGFHMDTYIYII